jgi:hypothetical protein
MNAYGGVGCIGTSWRGQLYAPAALPPGKEPPVPIWYEAGWAQSRSRRRGEEKILDFTGTRNSNPSVGQPVVSRYTDYAIPAPHVKPMQSTIKTSQYLRINVAQNVPWN